MVMYYLVWLVCLSVMEQLQCDSEKCELCVSATDIEFLDHCPSSMAAAAVLRATGETPSLESVGPGAAVRWCIGLAEVTDESYYAVSFCVTLQFGRT